MEPDEAARQSAAAIAAIGSHFMVDGATFGRGGELGFEGFDFYSAGRGGALGDVDGLVVAACFVFFNPRYLAESWERGRKVLPPLESAAAFAACGHAWAESHLADGPDYGRVAELSGQVVAGADIAGVPLFAAWSSVPEPDATKPLALHRLNLLRELRGGLHALAVVAAGLAPVEAVAVKSPMIAGLFGWTDPLPDAGPVRGRWEAAEQATDRSMGRALAVLDPGERAEFVELVQAVHGAVA